FFNDTATTEIYTLSLHDALPILQVARRVERDVGRLLELVARALRRNCAQRLAVLVEDAHALLVRVEQRDPAFTVLGHPHDFALLRVGERPLVLPARREAVHALPFQVRDQ